MALDEIVRRLAWRMRCVALARWLSVCLFWALGLAILLVALDKLIYLGIDPLATAAILVALAIGVAVVMLRRRGGYSRLRAAVETDRAMGLGDRLASALQLGGSDGPWAEAVARDAGQRLRDVRAADVFPLRPGLASRLLVPAAVVLALVAALPPADLFGRMEREVERRVAAQGDAERTQRAAAVAARRLPAGSMPDLDPQGRQGGLGGLRVMFVEVERDLAAGKIDGSRGLELSDRLRRMAELMAAQRADAKLTECIRKTAEALAAGDGRAADMLRRAQEELARLEEQLRATESMDRFMRKLAEKKRSAARTADTSQFAGVREPRIAGEPDAGLVEVSAVAKAPLERDAGAAGIIYSRVATGISSAGAVRRYEQAVRSARRQIDSGGVPAGYARLVRNYFDAIRPVHQQGRAPANPATRAAGGAE